MVASESWTFWTILGGRGAGGPFDLADSDFKHSWGFGDEEGVNLKFFNISGLGGGGDDIHGSQTGEGVGGHGLGGSDVAHSSWTGQEDGVGGDCLGDRGVTHGSWTGQDVGGGGERIDGLGGRGVAHGSWTGEEDDVGGGLGGRGIAHGSWTVEEVGGGGGGERTGGSSRWFRQVSDSRSSSTP